MELICCEQPRQWSKGGFIALLTGTEWRKANELSQTDDDAYKFLAVLLNSDYIREDDPRLSNGWEFFRQSGVTTRTLPEVIG